MGSMMAVVAVVAVVAMNQQRQYELSKGHIVMSAAVALTCIGLLIGSICAPLL